MNNSTKQIVALFETEFPFIKKVFAINSNTIHLGNIAEGGYILESVTVQGQCLRFNNPGADHDIVDGLHRRSDVPGIHPAVCEFLNGQGFKLKWHDSKSVHAQRA